MQDMKTKVDGVVAFAPGAATASANGANCDRDEFESVTALVQVGTWTDGTFTYTLEHADDNGSGAPGTYAACTADEVIGDDIVVSSAALNGTVQRLGYRGYKRWVRLVRTVAGATTGATFAAVYLRGHARVQPVA